MAIVGSATLAACGGDQDGSGLPATWVEAFESPYCVTARAWAVHELDGGGDGAYARGGPKALEMWWAEQLAYLETSLRQAPAEVRDAEAVTERFIRTRLTPLVRRYGFDAERLSMVDHRYEHRAEHDDADRSANPQDQHVQVVHRLRNVGDAFRHVELVAPCRDRSPQQHR